MLKTFENFKEYKIGDYILLHIGHLWQVEDECEIIRIDYNIVNNYQVKTYFKNNGKETKFWVDFDEIERKLTPKEVEKIKIRKDTNKYNL